MTLKLKKYIYKKFNSKISLKGGRNRMGRITIPHRGSKCAKKKTKLNIDIKNAITNLSYILLQVRPVSNRSGYAGLILYKNGLFSYILIADSTSIGTIWTFNILKMLKIGDYIKLFLVPEGFLIYNVELKLGYGGQISRAAGTSVKILNKYPNKLYKILVKFRSGEEYFINGNCGATIGHCSNKNHWLKKIGKAGLKRLFGFRSHVRGVAMNSIDHPHGGNTNGGKPCLTPKGLLTKGVKTRKMPIRNKVIFKRRIRKIDCFIKIKNYKT